MRIKEEAADYRYFPDPDLPLIAIDTSWIDRMRSIMPELPQAKMHRLITQKGLTPYEAEIIVDDLQLANYYEQAAAHTTSKLVVNWILRDLMAYIKEDKIDLSACKVTPEKLAQLVDLLETGCINASVAKEVFAITAQTGAWPRDIVKEKGLEQIEDTAALEAMVKEVIEQNPDVVAQYKSGKDKLIGFFVGSVMKKAGGKGNPKIIQDLLKKYLQ